MKLRTLTLVLSILLFLSGDMLRGTAAGESVPKLEVNTMDAENWQSTSMTDAPAGRYAHSAIWTGREVIIWGGYYHLDHFLNDGGRYDPIDDQWSPVSTSNAPAGRLRHSAVWTGQVMIVWGGESSGGGNSTNTGGIYDPITDSWKATSLVNAPTARQQHTAIWTGDEMIVWGGCLTVYCDQIFGNGARYDPTADVWTPLPSIPGLTARHFHQAVWTGTRMILWGGASTSQGVSYDPGADTWAPISTVNSPVSTYQGASVWTGNEMIVWGGCSSYSHGACSTLVGTGARYRPATDTWTPITNWQAPAARFCHSAVWTDNKMLIWGGQGPTTPYNTGAAYNPTIDEWTDMTTTGAPTTRGGHRAVWTGHHMVIWGGSDPGYGGAATYYQAGGRYTPESATTGDVVGTVWYDADGDAVQDAGEPGLISVTLRLLQTGLQVGQTLTDGLGGYRFTGLTPGVYTVREVQPPWLVFSSTPDEVVVDVQPGADTVVNFGDWNGLSTWLPLILR